MKEAKLKHTLMDLLMIIAGSVLFSISVNMFSVPNGIVQGGLTGVSIMLNRLFSFIPVGTAIFVLNIPLFISGYLKIGKSFILKTAVATFIFSFAIDIGELFIPAYTGDSILAALFCGVFSGSGLALVLISGATTGGSEIIAMLVRRKAPNVSIGRMILIVDLVIIAVSYLVYRNLESTMYAAVALFVSSKMIDFIIVGMSHNKMIFVVTSVPQKIATAVLTKMHRGVTVLSAKGGYTGEEKSVIFCVARASEISRINRLIAEIDSKAFSVISDVGEVFGEGFK
ncbi:MAG: YitT family protein [Faecalibacterium sp.]|nr:YitT family protein [Ruminococcus sp.]MCM1391176.1 YitT family protein [Ruminococcus sp.]MCM1486110.1 YitT family protein [Faecalibacterium sp.]